MDVGSAQPPDSPRTNRRDNTRPTVERPMRAQKREVLVVSPEGGRDEVTGPKIRGTYIQEADQHGHSTLCKAETEAAPPLICYFWQDEVREL